MKTKDKNESSKPYFRHAKQPLYSRDVRGERGMPRARNNEAENEQLQRWVADEDDFVAEQAYRRAEIRIKEGRADPVDMLAGNLRILDRGKKIKAEVEDVLPSEIQPCEPLTLIDTLSFDQLRKLLSDINLMLELTKDNVKRQYWTTLSALCDVKINYMQNGQDPDQKRILGVVQEDINNLLSQRLVEQLNALENQINQKLANHERIDVDYWELLLKQIQQWKLRAHITSLYGEVQRAYSEYKLRQQLQKANFLKNNPHYREDKIDPSATQHKSMSENYQKLRHILLDAINIGHKADKTLHEFEELFPDENVTKLEKTYEYEPEMPLYEARIIKGYNWNRYNLAHYTLSNPPPKIVLGYKFVVAYPELAGTSRSPTYNILGKSHQRRGIIMADDETCTLAFTAGPPYADVSFTIVSKDWDRSKKSDGYISSWQNGLLTLCFLFKKTHYR